MKHHSIPSLLTAGLLAFTGLAHAATPGGIGELYPARINQIAKFLPAKPRGFGQPIDNRAYWSNPELVQRASSRVKQAEQLMTRKLPAWDDQAYLEFSRTGERANGQKMENARSAWLAPLVLAECLENKGRFLPRINEVLDAYASEPTWTMPAHDLQPQLLSPQGI